MSSMQQAIVLNEQVAIGLLRDWTIYLAAQLQLLDQRDAAPADPFEQVAAEPPAERATRQLASLPPERRSLFERAVEERREERRAQLEAELRAEVGQPPRMLDPDLLDRTVLRELLHEAREPDETGHVLFPDADGQRVEWLELRFSALAERPDQATYQATAPSQDRERLTRMAAGVAIVVLLGFLFWYMTQSDQGSATHTAGFSVNQQMLTPWSVTGVQLGDAATAPLPLLPAPAQTWPADQQAHIRLGSYPLQICVPNAALEQSTTLILVGAGVPDRTYTLGGSPAHPDLLVSPCDDPERQVAGVLQSIQLAAPGKLGETRSLGDLHELTLAALVISGPAEESSIPQGAVRVGLALQGGPARDWIALAPTLRLGDGTQQTAPEVIAAPEGRAELRFLINAPHEPMPAELRLTDPATRQVVRLQVVLGPPTDRLSLLSQRLRIERVTASGPRELTITLTNTGVQPLGLTPADLLLEQEGLPPTPPNITGIETPLPSAETRTLTLALPAELQGVATLRIGTARYRITIE
jgi:hypothetical protein